MFIDDLISRNQAFLKGHSPTPWPAAQARELAIVSCYDPRLDNLLRPSLGLAPGEGFMLRTAGAVVREDILRALAVAIYLFEVKNVLVVGHKRCRMGSFPTSDFIDAFRSRGVARSAFGAEDIRSWARAISSPREGVLDSIGTIGSAPFLPADLALAGAVLDEETGRLSFVHRPQDPLPASTGVSSKRGRSERSSSRKNGPEAGRAPEAADSAPKAAQRPSVPSPPSPPAPATSASKRPPRRPERAHTRGGSPSRPPAQPASPPPLSGAGAQPDTTLPELHPAVDTLRHALESLRAERGLEREFASLHRALGKEPSTLRQLVLVLQFLKGAAADGHQVRKTIEDLSREISSSRSELPRQILLDLTAPRRGGGRGQ